MGYIDVTLKEVGVVTSVVGNMNLGGKNACRNTYQL